MKYEYLVVDEKVEVSNKEIQDILNAYGIVGWELVSTTTHNHWFTFFFKKPI